ncbi:MAG: hypothetical protein ACK41P_10830, partial [Asticcacaulis sp.]
MSDATKPAFRSAILAGAVSAMALMTASGAWAQSASPTPAPVPASTEGAQAPALSGVVNRIVIRGNERIDASTI